MSDGEAHGHMKESEVKENPEKGVSPSTGILSVIGLPEAVFLGSITAISYLGCYTYKDLYFSALNLPREFISIDVVGVLYLSAKISFLLVAFYLLSQVIPNRLIEPLVKGFALLGSGVTFIALSVSYWVKSGFTWYFLLFSFLSMAVVAFNILAILIHARRGMSWSEATQKELDSELGVRSMFLSTKIFQPSISENKLSILFPLLMGITLVIYVLGYIFALSDASQTHRRATIEHDGVKYAVVARYSTGVIAVGFKKIRPRDCLLTNEFRYFSSDEIADRPMKTDLVCRVSAKYSSIGRKTFASFYEENFEKINSDGRR